ncbi:FAD-binding oxidoreductase [Jatrophihabitans sp.]|uniref:FAD-binding oxidoreductase n=1 Tax=Jatrophihabitans sp. TaxID=1932789 RepID=UPI002BA69072|nr:FAD-binding oxidoreductase [Jatrophihabitans sp.]
MTATLPDRARAHAKAVAALTASYAAIPAGAQVRLAKRTSNLFRPRTDQPQAGLDVSGLDGVIAIDPVARTAEVQGMCTYERLVAECLPHGLMPTVVPQLKTITLGGAVTGLGIESSSFRNGLPHEAVLEMDVLTGDGELRTVSRTQYPDLFYGFPNSYGSLGYTVRLLVELDPVRPYVGLRNVRFADLEALAAAIATISTEHSWDGEPVDFLDGVMFSVDEAYLCLGRWVDSPAESGMAGASDYTGQQIYYRSIPARQRDCLTVSDYLWRWDTDWFWCSGAFGVQHPVIRRLWPARYRRSDFYHRLISLDHRFGVAAKLDRIRRRPPTERVVQDVEIPVRRTAAFLRWFAEHVGMSPVWLCPLTLREPARAQDAGQPGGGHDSAKPWPLYPLTPGQVYVNVGFWGTVPIAAGRADGDVNRLVEAAVAEHAGHKSLYSDAYYDRQTFAAMYGGQTYAELKDRYDPGHRLTGLYEKAVGRR